MSSNPREAASSPEREETAEEEREGHQRLHQVFGQVGVWQQERERDVHPVKAGSALAGDDRVTDPAQVSHLAWQCLSVAVDHLDCLRAAVQLGGSLHSCAPYTLIRSAVETAATAVYVLAPANRDERVRRRLRLLVRDTHDGVTARKAAGLPWEDFDRSGEEWVHRVTGRRPGVDAAAVLRGRRLGYAEVVGQAGDECSAGRELALTVWNCCSGMAHGASWASLALLDRADVAPPAAGVRTQRVTASASQVATMVEVAALLTSEAWWLYRRQAGLQRP